MIAKIRRILLRFHFIALTILVLNLVFSNITAYSFEGNLAFIIAICTIISGLILFGIYIRSLEKIKYYFSAYMALTLMATVSVIFRGIFGALILSLILFPIMPAQKQFETDKLIIASPFQGFIASCCSYSIKERKFLIFERKYGVFDFEYEGAFDFESLSIKQSDKEIVLVYKSKHGSEMLKKKIPK